MKQHVDELLRAHHVLVSGDNAFQRRARVLQALWRRGEGQPIGEQWGRPLGSSLLMPRVIVRCLRKEADAPFPSINGLGEAHAAIPVGRFSRDHDALHRASVEVCDAACVQGHDLGCPRDRDHSCGALFAALISSPRVTR